MGWRNLAVVAALVVCWCSTVVTVESVRVSSSSHGSAIQTMRHESQSETFADVEIKCPKLNDTDVPSMSKYYNDSAAKHGKSASANGWDYGIDTVRNMTDWMNILPGQTILDIGCGNGAYLKFVQQLYPNVKVIGVDPLAFYIDIAKNLSLPNSLFCIGKANSIQFIPDDSIDHYLSVFPHAQMNDADTREAMRQALRVLKRGGKMLIGSVNEQDTEEVRKRGQFARSREFYSKLAEEAGGQKPEFVATPSELARGMERYDVHWSP